MLEPRLLLTNLTPIPNQNNFEGTHVNLAVIAVDPANLPLTYAISGLPVGLSVNTSTGIITGTVSAGDAAHSPYTVQVSVSNAFGGGASESFTWTVGVSQPVLTPISNQSSFEGTPVNLNVAAVDPANLALTYAATGLPAGLAINPNSGHISGTISAGDSLHSPYSVQVTANNGFGGIAIKTFTWTVAVSQPALTSISNQNSVQGSHVNLTVFATDPANLALTYTATNLPTGLSISPTTGVITGTVAVGDAAQSPYSPQVTVSNAFGGSASKSFTWTVGVSQPVLTTISNQSSFEGTPVNLNVVAVDPANLALKYTATGLPAGLNIGLNTGHIAGTISAGDSSHSPYNVLVTASNGFGGTTNKSFTWTVAVSQPVLTPISNQATLQGGTVNLSVTATDPANLALTYTATGLPTGLSISSTTGVITGTIAAGDAAHGPYASQVTVSNAFGGTASSSFTWTIGALAPVVTSISNQSSFEGTLVNLNVVAVDPTNLALAYVASGLPAGLTMNSNSGHISGTISAGDSLHSPYQRASDGQRYGWRRHQQNIHLDCRGLATGPHTDPHPEQLSGVTRQPVYLCHRSRKSRLEICRHRLADRIVH